MSSSYTKFYPKQAYRLCLLGATNDQLADFFEVRPETIRNWLKAKPEFKAAVQAGRDEADAKVVKSLYMRATGYRQRATKIMQYEGEIITQDYVEHYPPDVTACIFWLKNRQPRNWKDRREVAVSDDRKADDLTDEELASIARHGGTGIAEAPEIKGKPH